MKENPSEIDTKLAELEQKAEQRKAELIQQQQKSEQLEKVFSGSGYETPVELCRDLVQHFEIDIKLLKISKRRPAKKVTVEFRDMILEHIENGTSMNKLSKDHDISYVVISNIKKGKYSHLKAEPTAKADKQPESKPAPKASSKKRRK